MHILGMTDPEWHEAPQDKKKVSPWPPVANFVPSGWMSTEKMGLPGGKKKGKKRNMYKNNFHELMINTVSLK